MLIGCVLSELHESKTQFKQINENLRLNDLCTKFHTFSFINNREKSGVLPIGFSSFLVNLS